MAGALGHLLALWRSGRCLARYRVLEVLDRGGPLPLSLRLARWIVGLGAGRAADPGAPLGTRLAKALEALGPAYIKLGQALATRPDVIGADTATALRALQDRLAPFDSARAHDTVASELGRPLSDIFTSFDDQPVAAASIAQVHRATTSDGRAVAVKILRPGIEARFARDLALFRWAARQLEAWNVKSRRLRPIAVVETLAEMVARELDLRLEAAAASELADNMAGEPGYHIPAVDWQRTARRVLTMDWAEGAPLTDLQALAARGIDTRPIATRLVRVFLTQAMRDGFFHADLHQGNLLIAEDGTVTAVDFGIVGRLDRPSRRYLAQILYGFLKRDYTRIAQVHFDAGFVPAHHRVADFAAAMRAIGEPIMGRPVKDISAGHLLAQLFATTERFDMATQPHLILLQKTMVMVEGLALALDPDINMWDAAAPVLEGWMREAMGPEARAADAIHDLVGLARRLPGVLAALEAWAENAAASPGAAPPPPRAAPDAPAWWLFLGVLTGATAAGVVFLLSQM
ncbi:MAG: 2-polyprenylphenol 6-hydroxylase [Pseudomonadota bacterium]